MSPLRTPVAVPTLDELGPTHFIAVGGAGMSGIAISLAQRGVAVSGSDQSDSSALAAVAAAGVRTFVGHAADQLGDARTVVVSSAIREDNVELAEARRRGLQVLHRSAALAALLTGHRHRVAVSGTHGKTTTTAMTAHALTAAGADPSYVIGGTFAGSGQGARVGGGAVMVIEADESDGTFLQYDADVVVVTNVEADHLDNWQTPAAYGRGFAEFVTAAGVDTAVLCADDVGSARLLGELTRPPRPRPRAVGYGAEATGTGVRLSWLDQVPDDAPAGTVAAAGIVVGDRDRVLTLRLPGRHNLRNAAAALTVVDRLGLDVDLALAALAGFTGTARRFQLLAEIGTDTGPVRIVDDYAHHPTELAVTVAAARDAVPPGGRLVVCFQPHLFTRTRDFAAGFGAALAGADVAVVLGIYPAREDPIPGVTGRLVADAATAAGAPQVVYVESVTDAPSTLATLVLGGDLVLTAGAGDVATVGPRLAELIAPGEEHR